MLDLGVELRESTYISINSRMPFANKMGTAQKVNKSVNKQISLRHIWSDNFHCMQISNHFYPHAKNHAAADNK